VDSYYFSDPKGGGSPTRGRRKRPPGKVDSYYFSDPNHIPVFVVW